MNRPKTLIALGMLVVSGILTRAEPLCYYPVTQEIAFGTEHDTTWDAVYSMLNHFDGWALSYDYDYTWHIPTMLNAYLRQDAVLKHWLIPNDAFDASYGYYLTTSTYEYHTPVGVRYRDASHGWIVFTGSRAPAPIYVPPANIPPFTDESDYSGGSTTVYNSDLDPTKPEEKLYHRYNPVFIVDLSSIPASEGWLVGRAVGNNVYTDKVEQLMPSASFEAGSIVIIGVTTAGVHYGTYWLVSNR